MKTSFIVFALLITSLIPTYTVYSTENTGKTYAQLQSFLASDQTDKITYTDTFNCVQFTQTLIDDARAQGFVVSAVYLKWVGELDGHDFTAFYTTDQGIVWIDPQDFSQYIQGGKQLCDTSGFCWDGIVSSVSYSYYPVLYDVNGTITYNIP